MEHIFVICLLQREWKEPADLINFIRSNSEFKFKAIITLDSSKFGNTMTYTWKQPTAAGRQKLGATQRRERTANTSRSTVTPLS